MIPDDLVPKDCPWPIVLGLDPGTLHAGYGAIVVAPDGPRLVTCGVFSPRSRDSVAVRLGAIQTELDSLLERLRPTTVALETAFAAINVHSALRLGEARGMMLATVARRGIDIAEYAPAQAKKAVLGHGAGSKEQVAGMVAVLLGLDGPAADSALDVRADATDALALALAHVHRTRLAERMRGSSRPSALERATARPESTGQKRPTAPGTRCLGRGEIPGN